LAGSFSLERNPVFGTLRGREQTAPPMTRFSQPPGLPTRTKPMAFAFRPNPGCPPSRPDRSDAPRRVALLVDRFATGASGARSAARCQRHLLYRAEPYEIDLLVELHPESNRLMVTGQVLDTSRPEVFRQ